MIAQTKRQSQPVAPVSAVCAAFATQSSAYPPEARRPDVAPTCGSVAGMPSAEEERLQAAFGKGRSRKRRSRTKPRGRAHPAAVTSARGAGSFGDLRGRSKSSENRPQGVAVRKKPAVSRKTTGLYEKSARKTEKTAGAEVGEATLRLQRKAACKPENLQAAV